jgi:hypothetical protein
MSRPGRPSFTTGVQEEISLDEIERIAAGALDERMKSRKLQSYQRGSRNPRSPEAFVFWRQYSA